MEYAVEENVFNEIAKIDVLCSNCGRDGSIDRLDLEFAENISMDEICGRILSMQLDAIAVQKLDSTIVKANRVIRKCEIGEMCFLAKINAFFFDSIGIGYRRHGDDLGQRVSTLLSSKVIAVENKDATLIIEHFASIIKCYIGLRKYGILDNIKLMDTAYSAIIAGHIPFEIVEKDGKEILIAY